MSGFIIAAIWGWLTPQLEAPIARPLARRLEAHMPMEGSETRLLAFMVALLGAAVLSAALDVGSVIGVSLGACLGYFGSRIFEIVKSAIDGKPRS